MACPLAQSLLHRVTKPWLPMEKPRIYPGTVGEPGAHRLTLPRCKDEFAVHSNVVQQTYIKEHKMHQARTFWIGLLAVVVVLVSISMTQATGAGIQDAAGFFSKDAIATAEQQVAAIHKKSGKDLRVETYASIPPDRADQYTSEKRNEFFSTWAYQRAKAIGLDGVIVLICKDPAFFQVEVGERTKHQAFTLANRDHMRDLLATAFKQRHFDDGLLQAVTYYGKTLQANLGEPGTGSRPSGAPAPGWRPSMPAPQESPPSTPQVNRSLLWIIGILVGGGVCLWLFLRRRSEPGGSQGAQPNSGYAPYDYRGAPPGVGYPPPDYRYGGGSGGGFGRGFGGGILGGLLGGWLGNRLARRDASSSPDASADPFPRTPGESGGFDSSPGPDFSRDEPSDSGGGGDFGEEREVNDEHGGGGSF